MIRTFMALTLATAAVGCAGKRGASTSSETAYDSSVREKVLESEGLVRQDIDLDTDGQPEIFNFFRERADAPRLLVRKELDLNRDGRVDIVSWFDPDGNLEKEEMDGDYDGHFDWTDHYKSGKRVMSEYDTDYDGKPNVYKYYNVGEDGVARLDRKERDTDGDGKIDVWERFNNEGEVVRTGRDTDGDGKMDVREE